jgi:hypothetical protein
MLRDCQQALIQDILQAIVVDPQDEWPSPEVGMQMVNDLDEAIST